MYQSTILGTSVRPLAPPNAVPRQLRPVTSWNGRVAISLPASATPMMMLVPQPRWQHSSAVRMTSVLPVASKVVCPAVRHLDDLGDDVLAAHALRVKEVGHPELAAPLLAVGVDVDTDDCVRADQLGALDDVEPDPAEPEHDHVCPRLNLGRLDHRADA